MLVLQTIFMANLCSLRNQEFLKQATWNFDDIHKHIQYEDQKLHPQQCTILASVHRTISHYIEITNDIILQQMFLQSLLKCFLTIKASSNVMSSHIPFFFFAITSKAVLSNNVVLPWSHWIAFCTRSLHTKAVNTVATKNSM